MHRATSGLLRWRWGVAAVLVVLASAGCSISVGDDDDDNGVEGEITIRVVNTTNVSLDPEIYLSASPVSAAALFTSPNKFTAFGVGTIGLLGPNSSDTFSVSCDLARVLGTSGGRFGDNLTDPDGVGRQIVLTQELNVFCGGLVTFTYSRSGDGFTTTFDVEP